MSADSHMKARVLRARNRSRRATLVVVCTALVAALVGPVAAPSGAAPAAPAGGGGPLSERLAELAKPSVSELPPFEQNRAVDLPATGSASLLRKDGQLVVDVLMQPGSTVDDRTLEAAGATVVARGEDGATATVLVTPDDLRALAGVDGLRWAQEILTPEIGSVRGRGRATSEQAAPEVATCPTGSTVSEGVAQLRADVARSTLAVAGAGVKVGILSDSFGAYPSEVTTDIANADLPGVGNPCGKTTPVKVISDTSANEEGRAMAHIVHDLAPDAQLLFASAVLGEQNFADNIRALRANGAKVIVDDITYLESPFYQDGLIAQAANEVTAAGATYLSSAANDNQIVGGKDISSYEAQAGFRPTTCPVTVTGENACHDFDPGAGVDAGNVVTAANGSTLRVVLQWSQPMYGVTTDLDVFLLDGGTGAVVTSSTNNSVTGGRPFEFASVTNNSGAAKAYRVVVARKGVTGTPRFKTMLRRPNVTAVQWNTSSGTDVVGPSVFGQHALRVGGAVAATPASNAATIETFSDRGPAWYCWGPVKGTTAAAALPACQSKDIDFAATDGVSTGVIGFSPFFGTSAAAPHSAGVAALALSKRPCRLPSQVLASLRASGRPIAGFTASAQGTGLIDAVPAVTGLAACSTPPGAPSAPKVSAAGATSVSLSWTPPSSTGGGGPIVAHHVSVFRNGGATPVLVVGTGSATSVNIGGLTPSSLYRFSVAAVTSGGGAGALSGQSSTAVPPFRTLDAFTTQQFKDFAGRVPTASELSTWRADLDTGSKSAAAKIAEASAFSYWGGKVDPVTRLFYAFFQRPPDTGGLTYWSGQLRAGKGLDVVANSFAKSNEFKTTYGALTNRNFVDLVYANVLGRAGEPGGVTYWTSQLDQGKRTRGQVMIGFSESPEHKTRRAGETGTVNLFLGMLRRAPTAAEVTTWKTSAAASRLALAQFLLGQPAYDARV